MQHFGLRATDGVQFHLVAFAVALLLLWGCARSESIEDSANSIANDAKRTPVVIPEPVSNLEMDRVKDPPVQQENVQDTNVSGTPDDACGLAGCDAPVNAEIGIETRATDKAPR